MLLLSRTKPKAKNEKSVAGPPKKKLNDQFRWIQLWWLKWIAKSVLKTEKRSDVVGDRKFENQMKMITLREGEEFVKVSQ
ncbi:MAG: hypothetical protein EBU89_07745 [Actinobacteria bacterium]|nr:hypothetical protein [Actinomycetota bacterium]